ncbi:uncharacterized protein L3040_006497 [Drepanopeziza brunnea f. sp. 'multigermtubi']|uniref:uncharacterized protein n=1 Tax=Drepanopeziza brunnea f. sp. 'multigermtubi' TaxID=698441 RepID=UPI00238432F5|nr:hypothetical protein L3040_006497 [Drepanopeziza brunnea f. sp. 'multigermtubi']
MLLRKGATFHSPTPTHPELELPYHFRAPALPRRSQTTLEDVVDAHKRRVALTLGDIDRGLAAVEDPVTARQSFPDEANPVPQGFLDHTVGTPATQPHGPTMAGVMDQEPAASRRSSRLRRERHPSTYSDSGLGSSIGSTSGKKATATQPTSVAEEEPARSLVTASAITRSPAAHSSTIQNLPRLSGRASNRIHEHILRPLLAKPSLQDFYPLVKDCPRRIHSKEIVCLRDLEKTLIFMAPERAKTAALYLDFCLTSIRCIQATVESLSDREQTRPHDRPYTNGYFVDLVDQIKQYAQQVQAAKEREEKGEKMGEMDPETTDQILLHGGLTKNGRPAELVRLKKNGKAISIATGLPVDMAEDSKDMRFKRSLSEEAEEDESILRSMARRKRSASAAELAPKRCREPGCDKEFKRPCDLTKHEKTHSRPWKCPVESCKYHEYGWPTEKEMDRHHNDKHSSAPPMYECHFKPCPYRSKRESNCKQHMEKAHGWTYVRSKNNRKNRDKASGSSSIAHTHTGLPTPTMTNMHTPSSDEVNMATPDEEVPEPGRPRSSSGRSGRSAWGSNGDMGFPIYPSDEEMFGPGIALTLDHSPISAALTLHSRSANGQSPFMGSELPRDQLGGNLDNFSNDGGNGDFGIYEPEDLYSANVQLPTPSHDVFNTFHDMGFETSGMTYCGDSLAHISPVGHGNTMLYTPTSLGDVDEGFEDFVPNMNCSLGHDFQLYPCSDGGTLANTGPSAMFEELPNPMHHFAGPSAQQLVERYAVGTSAVTGQQHHMTGMDWALDDQFNNGYQ